jgi:hypothetical protein
MRVENYYPQGKRWWVRLHEKGGERHEMPAHHTLEAYLDTYIEAAGIRDGSQRRAAELAMRSRSAATLSARRASRPILKLEAHSKTRRPWPRA